MVLVRSWKVGRNIIESWCRQILSNRLPIVQGDLLRLISESEWTSELVQVTGGHTVSLKTVEYLAENVWQSKPIEERRMDTGTGLIECLNALGEESTVW